MEAYFDFKYSRVSYLGYLWLFGSGFYLTGLTTISPIYIAFSITLVVFIMRITLGLERKITKITFIFLILTLFSLGLMINSPINLTLNFTISLLSPILIYIFFKDTFVNKKIIILFYFFYLALFLTDSAWRLTHPSLDNADKLDDLGLGYIIYKINSIMYLDSNFVGIQIVFTFSSFLYIFGRNQEIISEFLFKIIVILFFIAVLLTFSRASILGCVIAFYFYYLLGSSNKRKLLYFSTPFIALYLYYLTQEVSNQDISLNSKFILIDLVLKHINSIDLYDFLLGVGLGNAHNYLGMGAHNLFFTFLIEIGLIGFIIFLMLIVYFIFYFKTDSLFLIFPFLIVSLSLSGTALPYFWGILYFCVLIRNKRILIH